MGTFYKGYKQKNIVLEQYFQGYVTENNKKVPLKEGTTKYNAQFIQDINRLNSSFYSIMEAEKIAIKLLKMNSNYNEAFGSNLWNLIKAQGGTIRYNKVLKKALKSYRVDRQIVYDNIKRDIVKQEERVKRNSELVLSLLKEYGLGQIIDIIEKENNVTLFEHIKLYTDNVGKDLTFGANRDDIEEIREYYESLEDSYIDYVKEIASKNGLNIDNEVSDSFKEKIELMEEKKKRIKKEQKERKVEAKYNKSLQALSNDNMELQKEINSDRFGKRDRLSYEITSDLHRYITKLGGKAWYIATTRGINPEYYNVSGKLSHAASRIEWFKNKEDALQVLENNKELFDGRVVKVFNIVLLNKLIQQNNDIDRLGKLQNTQRVEIDSVYGDILSKADPDFIEKYDIAKILKEGNQYNFENSALQFSVFKVKEVIDNKIETSYLQINNNQISKCSEFIDATRLFGINDTNLIDQIQSKLGNNKKVIEVKIGFDSLWYKSRIKESIKKHQKYLNIIKNNVPDLTPAGQKNVRQGLIIMDEYKLSGLSELYYILLINVQNNYSFEENERCYYTDRYKKTINTNVFYYTKWFTNKEEAFKKALEINKEHRDFFAFVKVIPL